jgi:hypothetical protein
MTTRSRLITLGRKSNKIRSICDELIRSKDEFEKIATKAISSLEVEIGDLRSRSGTFGFNLPSIRDALCQDFQAGQRHWCPEAVGVIGGGPWQEGDFDKFLRDRQFTPAKPPKSTISTLVVGMSGWSDEMLSRQLVGKNTYSLRIYTQELFVFGIILGKDPYDVLEQEVIEEVAECHPAIQFILQKGFSWPWILEADKPVFKIKLWVPSDALAAVVGPSPLRRTDMVSRLWSYIVKHNLQDKVDRRMINADEKLEKIFGKPQVSMFELNGILARNLG